MAEYRQLTDGLDPIPVVPVVLSESTDLDALFVAIVGDNRDARHASVMSGHTGGPHPENGELNHDSEYSNDVRSAIARIATDVLSAPRNDLELVTAIENPSSSDEASQPGQDDSDSTATSLQSSNTFAVGDSWAAFLPESARETTAIEQEDRVDGGAIAESVLDLTALRERLQAQEPHRGVRTSRTLEEAATPPTNHSMIRIEWEPVKPARQVTTDHQSTDRMLELASPDALDELPRQGESFAVDRRTPNARSRRIAMVLVAAGVVVSSAIITVRAIPRTAKIAEPPTKVAPAAPDTRQSVTTALAHGSTPPAAEAAPVTPAAPAPKPRTSTTSSRGNDGRTKQAPGRDARRSSDASAAAAGSVSPVDGSAASTDTPIEPALPPAEAKPAPARELESGRSGVDPTVRLGTTATGTAGRTVDAMPPAATAPRTAPAELPAMAATPEPVKSAVVTASPTPPRLLQGTRPEYPQALRSRRIGGTVEVQVTIDETGRVTNAIAVSGPGPLRQVAADAVRSWRYQPATLNGVRTASTTTVSFHFSEK